MHHLQNKKDIKDLLTGTLKLGFKTVEISTRGRNWGDTKIEGSYYFVHFEAQERNAISSSSALGYKASN